MSGPSIRNVSAVEALRLFEQGEALHCPICSRPLRPIPHNWEPHLPLSGLECPVSQTHYLVYADRGGPELQRFRDWAKSRRGCAD